MKNNQSINHSINKNRWKNNIFVKRENVIEKGVK